MREEKKVAEGKELIDRYIYAVVRQLPDKQREDIRKELRSLIEDMLEERTARNTAETADKAEYAEVESVLLELGPPHELAAQYRGHPKYLIGPELIDAYWKVIKVVLISIPVAMGIVFAIEAIVNPFDIIDHFVTLIVNLITVSAQGFGWVTAVFIMLEHFKPETVSIYKKEWRPSELPEIPDPKQHEKKWDSVFSIIFSILFAVFFTFSVDLIGAFTVNVVEGGRTIIPFFNSEAVARYVPIVWILTAFLIVKEIFRMVAVEKRGALTLYHVLFNIASFIFMVIMLKDPQIWNYEFMNGLADAGILSADEEAFDVLTKIWEITTVGGAIIYIGAIATVVDTIMICYRYFRNKYLYR